MLITMHVPLWTDEQGVLRLQGSRLTLYTLISAYRAGETPEAIHEAFPSVSLSDVYVVIAYYLSHRPLLDAYLAQVEQQSQAMRHLWHAQSPTPTREDLRQRAPKKDDTR
jgi:uncharacterized protein (DUF433 family)